MLTELEGQGVVVDPHRWRYRYETEPLGDGRLRRADRGVWQDIEIRPARTVPR
ncbi:MAG: hypothetical protein ACRDZO_29210 [Egibacteraceae bacterium]